VLTPTGRLDGTWFASDKINQSFLDKFCTKGGYVNHSNFNWGGQYIYNGIRINVFAKPWNPAARKYKIHINPRRFKRTRSKGYGELCHKVFAKYGRYELVRMDSSVLFPEHPITIDLLHDCLYVKGKQISNWYGNPASLANESGLAVNHRSGIKTGFAIGENYERVEGYHCGTKRKGREDDLLNKINLELQWNRDTCQKYGMVTLEDMQSAVGLTPFENLFFYNIYSPKKGLSARELERAYDLQALSLKYGYHVAHSIMNRSGNFSRSYSHLFSELRVGIERVLLRDLITKGFKAGVESFFRD